MSFRTAALPHKANTSRATVKDCFNPGPLRHPLTFPWGLSDVSMRRRTGGQENGRFGPPVRVRKRFDLRIDVQPQMGPESAAVERSAPVESASSQKMTVNASQHSADDSREPHRKGAQEVKLTVRNVLTGECPSCHKFTRAARYTYLEPPDFDPTLIAEITCASCGQVFRLLGQLLQVLPDDSPNILPRCE